MMVDLEAFVHPHCNTESPICLWLEAQTSNEGQNNCQSPSLRFTGSAKHGGLFMAITVTEREHWKERIARRIDRAIEEVFSVEDPGLLERVKASAKEKAIESLGISSLMRRREEIKVEKENLGQEGIEVLRKMIAKIRSVDLSKVEKLSGDYYLPSEVDRALECRAEVIEQEMLAENPLGRQVLALRHEQEELLDTVWLATSGRQIKELWTSVISRLGHQSTELQETALNILPDKSDS